MFDQTDQRAVAVPPMQAEATLMGVLQQSGFHVQQTGPGTWACRAMPIYGLVPRINLRIADRSGGASDVWLHGYGDFDQNSMILGVILLVVFWPIAAILFYLGYDGLQKKLRMVGQYAWSQLPPVQGGGYPLAQQGYGQPPPY